MSEYYITFQHLNIYKKSFFVFWALGPFIFMLGRAPADLWLSIIVFIFIFHTFLKKNWNVLNTGWIMPLLYLFIVFCVASIFSENIIFCLSETFAWLRFPLYALAAQMMFQEDENLSYLFLYVIILALISMLFIGALEIIFDPKPRLYWPFSKQIPGSYVAKVFCLQ